MVFFLSFCFLFCFGARIFVLAVDLIVDIIAMMLLVFLLPCRSTQLCYVLLCCVKQGERRSMSKFIFPPIVATQKQGSAGHFFFIERTKSTEGESERMGSGMGWAVVSHVLDLWLKE